MELIVGYIIFLMHSLFESYMLIIDKNMLFKRTHINVKTIYSLLFLESLEIKRKNNLSAKDKILIIVIVGLLRICK